MAQVPLDPAGASGPAENGGRGWLLGGIRVPERASRGGQSPQRPWPLPVEGQATPRWPRGLGGTTSPSACLRAAALPTWRLDTGWRRAPRGALPDSRAGGRGRPRRRGARACRPGSSRPEPGCKEERVQLLEAPRPACGAAPEVRGRAEARGRWQAYAHVGPRARPAVHQRPVSRDPDEDLAGRRQGHRGVRPPRRPSALLCPHRGVRPKAPRTWASRADPGGRVAEAAGKSE